MIEDSEDYNFERMPWDSKQIKRIIATERSHRGDRLPNLTGVTVYVAGATIDSSGSEGKRMRLQRQIEDFWLAYFKACNADASDSRYARVLLNWQANSQGYTGVCGAKVALHERSHRALTGRIIARVLGAPMKEFLFSLLLFGQTRGPIRPSLAVADSTSIHAGFRDQAIPASGSKKASSRTSKAW